MNSCDNEYPAGQRRIFCKLLFSVFQFGVSECTPVSRDTCGWECDPLIGYAVGDNGCEICDCDWSRQCPIEFVCDLTCPFGYM